MPNHFSTIGFDVQSKEEFVELAQLVKSKSQCIVTRQGEYFRWTGNPGEQLWLQYDSKGEFLGMNPHFNGKSSVKIELLSCHRRQCDSMLDGTFQGGTKTPRTLHDENVSKFLFDVPDASNYFDLDLPQIASAQIAAFAHEISNQTSGDQCNEAKLNNELKFIYQSLEDFYALSDEAMIVDLPEAMVKLSGEVVESTELKNQITNRPYYWALVDTIGGSYDIVIDKSLINYLPMPGHVLSGTFWLSGKILSYFD